MFISNIYLFALSTGIEEKSGGGLGTTMGKGMGGATELPVPEERDEEGAEREGRNKTKKKKKKRRENQDYKPDKQCITHGSNNKNKNSRINDKNNKIKAAQLAAQSNARTNNPSISSNQATNQYLRTMNVSVVSA